MTRITKNPAVRRKAHAVIQSEQRTALKSWQEERDELAAAFVASLPHAADMSLLPATSAPFYNEGIWSRGRKVEMRRDLMWRGMAVIMGEAHEQRQRIAKLRERLEGDEGKEISETGLFNRADLQAMLFEMERSADAAEAVGCAIRQAVIGHCEHTQFKGMDSCPFAIVTEGEPELAPQYAKHDRHLAFGQLFPENCKECEHELTPELERCFDHGKWEDDPSHECFVKPDIDMGPVVGGINPLANPFEERTPDGQLVGQTWMERED